MTEQYKHPYPNVVVGYTDLATGEFVESGGSIGGGGTAGGLTDEQLRAEPLEVKVIEPSYVQSVKVNGVTLVRDPTQDREFVYADGTSEVLYFTTDGEFAGQTARE